MAKAKKKAARKSVPKKLGSIVSEAMVTKEEHLGITPSTTSTIEVTRGGVPLVVTLKVDKQTNADWVSTRDDAANNKLITEPFDGFLLIDNKPEDQDENAIGFSTLGGKLLKNGEILQVQFPNNQIVELEAHIMGNGFIGHRSWWGKIAVSVPLAGCYARRVNG